MRFGMFIPQGWRHDLVDIEPASQWGVMKDLALRADGGPWESVWVYDHFHTVPKASEEATHEAWTLMAALGAVTERVRPVAAGAPVIGVYFLASTAAFVLGEETDVRAAVDAMREGAADFIEKQHMDLAIPRRVAYLLDRAH